MWTKADADLIEQGNRELYEIGLLDDATDVEAGYVVRMPKAYPMYDGTYKANVETMRKWIDANAPNVFPVGRNGMHKYNNQDHSMYTAMLSVENIFGADHDVWNVNVEAEYHEEKGAAGAEEQVAASPGAGASTAGESGREGPTK
jgi:protoporphyrinogen oxidase